MSLATAHDFGIEFAESIGLDTKNLTGFTLRVRTGEVVLLNATYLLEKERVFKSYNIARNYQLVEAE